MRDKTLLPKRQGIEATQKTSNKSMQPTQGQRADRLARSRRPRAADAGR